jgi:hypothetical protein
MTLHVVLFTGRRDGLVWVTERGGYLGVGQGNYATVEKISYLSEHGIAYSAWGDIVAIEALVQLKERIRDDKISLPANDPEQIMQSLRNFANDVLPAEKRGPDAQFERPDSRGLILATLGTEPRVYRLALIRQPVCFQIHDEVNATAGDPSNPANLFVRYYYPRCGKTLKELLLLAIHTVRLAHALNSGIVGEPDAWACENGKFDQLNAEQLAEYVKRSRALDYSTLEHLLKS